MSSTSLAVCPCGVSHPLGAICEKGREILRARAGQKARAERKALSEGAARATVHNGHGHEHSHEHPHAHSHEHADADDHDHACCCCGHDHAGPAPVDTAALGEASDTRAIYRIANMDCPMEENLIRKRLASVEGIDGLEFDLMRRVLTVNHHLASTAPIEEALLSIDMKPEALGLPSQVSTFSVSGMDCPEEEKLIRAKLEHMPGVRGLEFNLMTRALTVTHAPGALPDISGALASLNMGARLMESADERTPEEAPKIAWKKLAVAGVLGALSEILHLAGEWGARPFGVDVSALTVAGHPLPEVLALVFALVAIALAGLGTYRKGWLAVSNFNLNINALMSVAVTGAVLIGQFPEAAMVMVLFNLSEAIEARSLNHARNAIRKLLALAPERATVLQPDGSWVETDIREVPLGARVRVRPGEKIAMDGTVVLGHSTVNQAPITGESMPVDKGVGDHVFAGTVNGSGSFEFESTALATNSTLARIIHAVEEAQGTKAPMQRFVDAFARFYTPAVFLIALGAALVPPVFFGAALGSSVYTALVVLVIGCPCALVISTPVSIVSGMAAATRAGILVKGGMFLEKGRLLRAMVLDKTGTITHGTPSQTAFEACAGQDPASVRTLAASLANRSDHPVSAAVARAAMEDGVRFEDVEDFEALPGEGVRGRVEGRDLHLGSLRMVRRLGLATPDVETRFAELEKKGWTVVALCGEHAVLGLFAVADTARKSSLEAIAALKELGVRTVMLTGDNEHTARVVAAEVGVDEFRANMLPEDKLAVVTELEKQGPTGMVGDGINDAPALARASVGFAMARGGTDTAIETADVALMDDDLRKLPRFITLSRATYAILVQNIVLALGIKALFFALTFTGNATMWMAVFADVGTSLMVVANGLRAMKK